MTDVDHPVLASKKIIRDKYLWACTTIDCEICTFMTPGDGPVICLGCRMPAAKLRDPLPEHVSQSIIQTALDNA